MFPIYENHELRVVKGSLETQTRSCVKKPDAKDDNKSFYPIWSDYKACLLQELTYFGFIRCNAHVKKLLVTVPKILTSNDLCPTGISEKENQAIESRNNLVKYEVSAVPLQLSNILLLHLEGKVCFSGGSNGIGRRWDSETVNKKLENVKDDFKKVEASFSGVDKVTLAWSMEVFMCGKADGHINEFELDHFNSTGEDEQTKPLEVGVQDINVGCLDVAVCKHQRETTKMQQNMEKYHDGSLSEFLRRKEAFLDVLKREKVFLFIHSGAEYYHSEIQGYNGASWIALEDVIEEKLQNEGEKMQINQDSLHIFYVDGALMQWLLNFKSDYHEGYYDVFYFSRPPELFWNMVDSRSYFASDGSGNKSHEITEQAAFEMDNIPRNLRHTEQNGVVEWCMFFELDVAELVLSFGG